MSRVPIKKLSSSTDRDLPIFSEIDELDERIRARAYELFADRASGASQQIRDWLIAEREYSWLPAELHEGEDDFALNIALPGFEPREIAVTATPREVIVKAGRKSRRSRGTSGDRLMRWSELRTQETCRRITLPADIDVKKVSAELEDGLLKITLPKLSRKKARKIARKKSEARR